MKWITRVRPRTDRIACPWLIRRFIDPDAEILYVPAEDVIAEARRVGGRSFDAPGADFAHSNGNCTFEVLLDRHALAEGNPALTELARIVHAADIEPDVGSHPFGAALRAIGEGGLDVEADDARLLDRATFVYDALYAHCVQVTSSGLV